MSQDHHDNIFSLESPASEDARNYWDFDFASERNSLIEDGWAVNLNSGRNSVRSHGSQWDRTRCCQRMIAAATIVVIGVLSSTVSLEFLLPGLVVKLPPPVCSPVQDYIKIQQNFTGVVWEGWGVSLGWWAYWAGGLPEPNRTALVDSIYSREKGLGLNIVRYNIGGGGNTSQVERFQRQFSYRALPGFKESPWSPYNFSQDLNQRTILFAARGRGPKLLEAYSYSPPAWMTISGDFAGGNGYKVDNLDPSNYSAYAGYIADVVQSYETLWGVTFDSVSPVNEPVEGWWVAGGGQEGCNFSPESLNKFLPFVKQALIQRGLNTSITAFDSWTSSTPKAYAKFGSLTRSVISKINVHSYQPSNGLSYSDSLDYRAKLAALAKDQKKPVHVSEWGPIYLLGSELDIALIMGRTISLDVNVMRASAWSYWQAVEDVRNAPYWGLIYTESLYSGGYSLFYRKQYFVLMQFSKWILPGSFLAQTDAACNAGLVVAYQAALKRIVMVVTNEYTREQVLTFHFRQFASINESSPVDIYRTSENENHEYVLHLDAGVKLPGIFTRTIARKSVTTYVISGVKLT